MRPRSFTSAMLAVLATAGLLATGSQAVAAPQAPRTPASASTYNLTTVIDQWTHWSPDPYTSTHAGTLYAGTSYFYCWVHGAWYSNNGHSDDIWLLTDDDTGNGGVYVSDVNLDSWGWHHDQQVLSEC
ncbi:hypothetical protein OHT77_00420 [Streptomyces sp. NBC_00252]|uniref:hypothetical protein n=1 Tax=Streptomyces sp. NBC_00252 TaxID=2975691 RepID=UPI002E2B3E58|nr:hypothetical protein [Streptomyces sp. NBC_00252]